MNLHEYQAKKLFEEYNIPVPSGLPAHSIKEALQQASAQHGSGWVIKAQVHAGGRGKAGGVKLAETMEEVEENDKWIDEFEPPKSVQDTVGRVHELEIELAKLKLLIENAK